MTTNLFSIIIVLGVLVFFHELGHFLVARWFGVGVEKFSLGFGPRLFGRKVGMTEYIVSAIPLGGYVKMVGEDPGADITDEERHLSFTHKVVWQRMLIVAAGPVFNLILADLIYTGLFGVYGVNGLPPVIGVIKAESPAAQAGLGYGDRVIAAGGKAVVLWNDISEAIEASDGNPLALTLERSGDTRRVEITPEASTAQNLFGEEVPSWAIGIGPIQEPVIGGIQSGSPAEKAELKVMDRILAVGGTPLAVWGDVVTAVTGSEGEAVELYLLRDGAELSLTIQPELMDGNEGAWRIGIAPYYEVVNKRLGFVGCITEGVGKTLFLGKLMVVGLVKMVKGNIAADLGGPIIIAKMAGDQARVGISSLISFIAFISINLAILNFLPIPVLDGGHLVFFAIEWITGKPVNDKAREVAQQAGMFLLLSLMVYVFYSDITKLFFK
jgi:regulator of sigma E protease